MRIVAALISLLLVASCRSVPAVIDDKTGEKIADVSEQNTDIALANKEIANSFDVILNTATDLKGNGYAPEKIERIETAARAGKEISAIQETRIAEQTKTIKGLWAAKIDYDKEVSKLVADNNETKIELQKVRSRLTVLIAVLAGIVLLLAVFVYLRIKKLLPF